MLLRRCQEVSFRCLTKDKAGVVVAGRGLDHFRIGGQPAIAGSILRNYFRSVEFMGLVRGGETEHS